LLHHAVDPTGFRWQNISRVIDILLDHLAVPVMVGASSRHTGGLRCRPRCLSPTAKAGPPRT
jgi:hypothetical protein